MRMHTYTFVERMRLHTRPRVLFHPTSHLRTAQIAHMYCAPSKRVRCREFGAHATIWCTQIMTPMRWRRHGAVTMAVVLVCIHGSHAICDSRGEKARECVRGGGSNSFVHSTQTHSIHIMSSRDCRMQFPLLDGARPVRSITADVCDSCVRVFVVVCLLHSRLYGESMCLIDAKSNCFFAAPR